MQVLSPIIQSVEREVVALSEKVPGYVRFLLCDDEDLPSIHNAMAELLAMVTLINNMSVLFEAHFPASNSSEHALMQNMGGMSSDLTTMNHSLASFICVEKGNCDVLIRSLTYEYKQPGSEHIIAEFHKMFDTDRRERTRGIYANMITSAICVRKVLNDNRESVPFFSRAMFDALAVQN